MKKNYIIPSVSVVNIKLKALLVNSGDNNMQEGEITSSDGIAAKNSFVDYDMESDVEE